MKTTTSSIFAAMALVATVAADTVDWSAYSKSFDITFPGYTGQETLTDFPVLIRLSAERNDFRYDKCRQPDGGDLRFSDVNGNLLASEIDTWDPAGESLVWVKVPSLNASTTITAHYGCASPAAVNPKDVWSNGYLGVWHMNESARPVLDSSANGINFTRSHRYGSGNEYDDCIAFAQAGAVGKSVAFDPTVEGKENQGGLLATDSAGTLSGLAAMTIEIWAKTDTFDASRYLVSRRMGNNQNVDGVTVKYKGYEFSYSASRKFAATFYLDNGANNDNDKCAFAPGAMSTSLTGQWNYHCASYDSSATVHTNYLNRTVAQTVANSTGFPIHDVKTDPLCLGNDCQSSSTKVFNGSLDELRISNVARSKDWVNATYDTVHDENFARVVIPNNWKAYSHTFSLTFPLDGYPEGTTLTDFPVLVKVSTNDISGFRYTDCAKANGEDLRFADAEGNLLDSEIDTWDPTGESFVWVKVPSLSANTTIKGYYGWAFAPAVNPQAVWSNGYLGVWHMDESDRRQSDSTLNNKTLDGNSNYAANMDFGVSGAVGKGVEQATPRNSAYRGGFQVTDSSSLYSGTKTLTVEVWTCQRAFVNDKYIIRQKSGAGITEYAAQFTWPYGGDNAKEQLNYSVNMTNLTERTGVLYKDIRYVVSTNAGLNTWKHHVLVVDNESLHRIEVFLDGESKKTQAITDPDQMLDGQGDTLAFGNSSNGGTQAFPGTIDEIRVSSVARSAAWVKATYDTIADNAVFATYSSAKENSLGTFLFFR